MRVARLTRQDAEPAQRLFALMAEVFDEASGPVSAGYVERLLGRDDFWALAAFDAGTLVGGLTAHQLPMTRAEGAELFVYDIAVHADHQRRGVGRALWHALREAAAVRRFDVVFVAADNEDEHALDFYRALGGAASPVTVFTFSPADGR